MTDDITNDLALLDDWLAGKGYGEEASLCMRAMDLIRKQADEIEKLHAARDAARMEVIDVVRENDKLRAALKLMIDTQDDWEQSVAKIIGKQPSVFNRAIDAAKAALGESDEG